MIKILNSHIKENTGILIRLDDIAECMNWNLMNKCETLFNKFSIKPLLGVIPNNQDKDLLKQPENSEFWNKVRGWQNQGWEIAMHGYTHIYDSETKKKDYFNYGGSSEFCGHTFDEQFQRLKQGLKKFENENINIRSFFAPNHTYDENTFLALKKLGIKNIIDGYGLFPYIENGINFTPQLFYENIMLPFGIQSTQIHLNFWNEEDFSKFEKFIEKYKKNIKNYDQVLEKTSNSPISMASKSLLSTALKFKRRKKNIN